MDEFLLKERPLWIEDPDRRRLQASTGLDLHAIRQLYKKYHQDNFPGESGLSSP